MTYPDALGPEVQRAEDDDSEMTVDDRDVEARRVFMTAVQRIELAARPVPPSDRARLLRAAGLVLGVDLELVERSVPRTPAPEREENPPLRRW